MFLLLGWACLSVIGYMGKDTIYQKYTVDVKTTPYFVLVFQGIHDGIYPWSKGMGHGQGYPWDGFLGEDNVTELADAQDTEKDTAVQEGQPVPNPTESAVGNGVSAENPVATEEGLAQPPAATEQTETVQTKEFINVENDYFDDAVFIGDSRTVGLHDYGGLDKATFYATVGLNIYDMWTERFCEVNGEKLTLEEALTKQQFKKIYFQIGINEMGRGTVDTFMQAYESSVRKFQELQPEAIIYVQGIMRVTKEKSDADPIFNNPGIQVRNDRIKLLADNNRIFYIDVNEVVCDDQGNLKPELTFDKLHLYASKYYIWVDFLKTKGIALESA